MKQAELTLIILTAMLVSCAINPNLNELNSSKASVNISAPKDKQTAQRPAEINRTAPREYRLGYGDVLEIKFFNNSEYNEVISVRPDGKISLQRIGDINVAGMSVCQLDSIITASYSDILVDPDATVIVREFGGQYVYVMGEVLHPGSYDVTKGMSLLRAITTAGGPLFSAKMNSIILVRGDEQCNLTAERFNLLSSNLEMLLDNDVQIQPYDLVYVPKTFVADLESFVTQIYKIIMPPIDLAARFQYYNNIR